MLTLTTLILRLQAISRRFRFNLEGEVVYSAFAQGGDQRDLNDLERSCNFLGVAPYRCSRQNPQSVTFYAVNVMQRME